MTHFSRITSVTMAFLVGLLLVFGGCRVVQIKTPEQVRTQDWLAEGGGRQHTHAVDTPLTPPLEQTWLYNAGGGFGNASPLVLRDVVLVPTRKGELHAINIQTGKKAGLDNFGNAIEGTPVIEEGKLFIPVAGGRQALVGYDLRRGQAFWKVRGVPIEAGLLLDEGRIFSADLEGEVVARNVEDGSILWQRVIQEAASVYGSPVWVQDRLVVANEKGRVVALNPDTGQILWSQEVQNPVLVSLAAFETTVLVPTSRGVLFALDAHSGKVLWQFDLQEPTVRFSSPAIHQGKIVVGASDGRVRMIDLANGALRWEVNLKAVIAAPPLVAHPWIYVGTTDGMLYALDHDAGAVAWKQELKGRMKSSMVFQPGKLIVLTEPSYVYLFASKPTPVASKP